MVQLLNKNKPQQKRVIPEPLRNGDKYFVNGNPVLYVTPLALHGEMRMVHYTNGKQRKLRAADVVTCRKAPVPGPGESSPLPQFNAKGLPVAADRPKKAGLGYTPKGGSAYDTPAPRNEPGGTQELAGTSHMQPIMFVRKKLAFQTPRTKQSVRATQADIMIEEALPSRFAGRFADPAEPEEGQQVVPKAAIAKGAVPAEMQPEDAVELLLTKDYLTELPGSELVTLLWHAAGYAPTIPAETEEFVVWWYKIYSQLQISNVGKFPVETVQMLRAAESAISALAYPDPEGADDDEEDAADGTAEDEMVAGEAPTDPKPAVSGALTGKVVASLDDDQDYPACFGNWASPTPDELMKLQFRWMAAMKNGLKDSRKATPSTGNVDAAQFIEALLEAARTQLMAHQIPDAFRKLVDPDEEMAARLVLVAISPMLHAKLKKHLPVVPTAQSLRDAIELELGSAREVAECRSKCTGVRMVTKFFGGSDAFPAFLLEFNAEWARVTSRVGFTDPTTELDRKISTFVDALPWKMGSRMLNRSVEKYKGDYYPPTWKATLEMATSINQELKTAKESAEAVQQPAGNRASGSGGRALGGRANAGSRGAHGAGGAWGGVVKGRGRRGGRGGRGGRDGRGGGRGGHARGNGGFDRGRGRFGRGGRDGGRGGRGGRNGPPSGDAN